MEFDWNDKKYRKVLNERGFGFNYASRVFSDPNKVIEADKRFDYKEERFRVYDMIDGGVYCVVYTMKGNTFYIITTWKANRREVRYYEENQVQG
ncbi:MAG: BrnT family toxin [Rhodobacteraceae bacterium]|nr:BrnT family toxin [Paracoccaceae bacterium]